ncbi:MAG: PIN domain-containing protein [Dysgonamonadaceae bacterium]|jgi:predicted nucleic acid-binding protein|nr:PIN domain-containing protein [Dysgonamonadaceae bacterium]
MQDKFFLDTNVLIYAYSNTETVKQSISGKIMENNCTVISTQVLQEITNILRKKFGKNYTELKNVLEECKKNIYLVHTNTYHTVLRACDIAERYRFSFYDSMIVAAALESKCKILYSEDLQHKQIIDNQLTVFNPFV